MREIERKFLIKNLDFKTAATQEKRIKQGYLNSTPERTVRIRIQDNTAFITVKGKTNASGTTRFEWEKEIPSNEAEMLITLCEDFSIEKTRYLVPYGQHIFEVDIFHGINEGLILAEVELTSEEEQFEIPSWLGEEVTGQPQYYNSYLSTHPFKK